MTSKAGKSFSGKLFLDKTEKAENQFRIRKTKTDLLTVKSVKEDLRTGIRYYDHHIYNHPKELYLTTKKPRLIFRRDTGLPNQSGLKIKPQPFIMINAFTKFVNALRRNFLIKISNRIKQSSLKKTYIPILKHTAILFPDYKSKEKYSP